jgi:hypothetical protein
MGRRSSVRWWMSMSVNMSVSVSVGRRITIVSAIRVRVRGYFVGSITPDIPSRAVVQRMSTRSRHGPHPLPSRVELVLLAIHDR